LLKLKKLEILGFKSFCDRTEVKFFGEGIAAIVGPNGCGKSNIADAIAWVLGEQSAKTLRGSRMEDVIFAGTRDRNPTGMAEVSLTLIDPEAYTGALKDFSADPEIDIRDDRPAEDWDEAAVRATAAAETDRVSRDFQPGVLEEEEAEENPEAEAANPEVVLKVRRRNLKLTGLEAGQIVVTRRLFRSGQSEYLLNGKLCRLRDIQEIFLGTGLGPESYAIIEQGRIGQILSSRPHDRRAIIEEAAGITKFKTKKRLAEARLEQAQLNLARINDIFEEVTRQMNSLKRQASKAERYARLREEMRAKLRVVLASKFAQFNQEDARLQAELAGLGEELRLQSEAVQQREQQQAELTQRGYAIETEVAASRERSNAIVLESDRAAAQQRHNQERCAELDARSTVARSELEQALTQHVALESERLANQGVLDSAAAAVAAAQAEAERCQQEAAAATQRLAELEQSQEQRRLETLQAIASASEIRNQAAQAEEHLAALGRESRRLQQERAAADSEMEAFGGRRGQLALEFESASQKVTALTSQIADSRQWLQEKRAAEAEAKQQLDGLRASYANLLGRRNSLDAVIAEHGYSTESVKRLLQPGGLGNGFKPIGVLADFVEVDGQYERVVEDFLRDELNYIVVKSWDSADEGLRLLRTDVDGRATFLVHPQDSQAKFSFVAEESAHPVTPQKSIVPLKSCIRVLNGFGKSLEVILPKLREGYIAADPKVARDLALSNPDAFFLASSGETFHNVTVTGGKQRSEGPLSLKRELREVARQLEETEGKVREQEARVGTLSREIAALTSLLDRVEEEKREDEKLAMTSGHSLQQLESELERSRQRAETCQQELERIQAERTELEGRLAQQRETIAAFERRRAQLEQEAAAAQESSAALKQARETAAQTAAEGSVRLATLEERRIAAAAAFERIQSLVTELAARMQTLSASLQAFAEEHRQREAETLQLAQQLVALAAEREAAETRSTQLRAESEQARAQREALEQELRAARQSLDQARDRKGELGVASARLTSDRNHLAETCQNELGLLPEQLLADASVLVVTGEQLTAEDASYHEMRSRLEAMGPVNMMALEEYNETAQRHGFLEGQRKDLLESIANTQNTIREIDTVSRQLFQQAFERINENFQMTFRKLFGGGQGFMRLTDEENTAESGIDVVASPPGKKLQNVLLLSGGEKALTALALLVGIFQYQPSPFCLLDEVDAPLDETNIGRFLDLVREMSERTQFVLITHSKKTMGAAPVMYGVTMQQPGVSKLVSVKFGEPALASARA
jgi:chromosome segregation protein